MNHIVKPFRPYFNTPLDSRRTQGLIAYYDATIQKGGQDLFDLHDEHKGTLSGASWDYNCINFANSSDVINVGRFDLIPPMTIMTKVLWDGDTTRNHGIVGKRDTWSIADMRWVLYHSPSLNRLFFHRPNAQVQLGNYILPSNVLVDLCVTVDSNIILYANGQRIATATTPTLGTDTAAMVRIGNNQSSEAWSGKIVSVKLFNRVLAYGEILSHYQDPYYFYERPKIYGFISSSSGSSIPVIINNYRQQGVM